MAQVVAVSCSEQHTFSKQPARQIELIKGEGVVGDAHRGVTVQHRSRVAKDPNQPNLRQVHLIQQELIEELQGRGFAVEAGTMGENITTCGLDLLALPTGSVLTIGETVRIEVTGLRNPCAQLDRYQQGLTAAVLDRDEHGQLIRRAGVMGVVLHGGPVQAGDSIAISLPALPHAPLAPV
ncbi:molybdenum cofactor biosysynthesis protein [Pokkaliibacter plantistimulans]|uniref:Molybdenum cofactor biosysynthesis protein n=1 Tax=Pokkaliibacter plantistimulans TaxID=1635171 RepID=A0ABX5LWG5_9GAMM|nr:MOSC domain-containing protein [Pokkaliibacter plantistimulans]PXF30997.1 molybdenum cofactor biosysynthesis protein [Pokkaliibacter plantistimulans]